MRTAAAAPITADPKACDAAPKATTITATSSPSSETPLNERTKPFQSKPAGTSSSTCSSPLPVAQPSRETARIPFRSHCEPKGRRSAPTTSRSGRRGTSCSAVPSAPIRIASSTSAATAPRDAARHDRVTPTATTMATISITSIVAARNVETRTLTFMVADGLPDDCEQIVAGLLAAAAGCGADAAVLVVMGVPLALLAASTARRRACLDRCADDAELGLGLARDDAASRAAQIGAVETKADAADEVPDVVLAEARVGTAGAGHGALEAVVDAAYERLSIGAGRARMRLDELSNGRHQSVSSRKAWTSAANCSWCWKRKPWAESGEIVTRASGRRPAR